MDPKDKKIVEAAVAIVENMGAMLANVGKRGASAAKFWAAEAKKDYQPLENQKILKSALVPGMLNVLKHAKSAQKDLDALEKEASDPKRLAGYPDGKAFRVKATKLLGSAKDVDDASAKVTLALLGFGKSMGKGMYPGMNEVDVKATLTSLENFRAYLNAIRVALAKL